MVKNFFLIIAIGIILYYFIKNDEMDTFEVSFTKHPNLIISDFKAIEIKDMYITTTSVAKNMIRETNLDTLFKATFSTMYKNIKYNFKSNQIKIKDKVVFFDGNVTLHGSNNIDFFTNNLKYSKKIKQVESNTTFKAITPTGSFRGDSFQYNITTKNLFAKNIKMIYEY